MRGLADRQGIRPGVRQRCAAAVGGRSVPRVRAKPSHAPSTASSPRRSRRRRHDGAMAAHVEGRAGASVCDVGEVHGLPLHRGTLHGRGPQRCAGVSVLVPPSTRAAVGLNAASTARRCATPREPRVRRLSDLPSRTPTASSCSSSRRPDVAGYEATTGSLSSPS